jgi:hypothetical protein
MDELEAVRSFRRNDVTPNRVARAAARDRLIAHIAHDDPVDESFDPVMPRLPRILGGIGALATAIALVAGLIVARDGFLPFTGGSSHPTSDGITAGRTTARSGSSNSSRSRGSSAPSSRSAGETSAPTRGDRSARGRRRAGTTAGHSSSTSSARGSSPPSSRSGSSRPSGSPAAPPPSGGTPAPSRIWVTATARAMRDSYNGDCPPPADRFPYFEGVIGVSRGPVTVQYQWLSSTGGGADHNIKTITFSGSGPQWQTVHFTQRIWPSDNGGSLTNWAALYVREPVATVSNRVSYTIVCTLR